LYASSFVRTTLDITYPEAPVTMQKLKRLARLMPANCITYNESAGSSDFVQDGQAFEKECEAMLRSQEDTLKCHLKDEFQRCQTMIATGQQ
jgi:hypothetical protein